MGLGRSDTRKQSKSIVKLTQKRRLSFEAFEFGKYKNEREVGGFGELCMYIYVNIIIFMLLSVL